MSLKSKIARPNRDPDHYSKRGVPYWFSPDWVRGTGADIVYTYKANVADAILNSQGDQVLACPTYGKIHPVKENGDVNLYMKSKSGNLSYIKGSIQKEFKKWHEDRWIDYLLLGVDPDEVIDV